MMSARVRVFCVGLHLLLLTDNTVAQTGGEPTATCSLDKAEESLTLALGIIKLAKKNGNLEDVSILNIHKDAWTSVTSSSLVTTNKNQTCNMPSTNCADIRTLGYRNSGIYDIYPKWQAEARPYKVYCDMDTDGGGWTVIQRRVPSTQPTNFNRTWAEYKRGFGAQDKDFWLGNHAINLLTTQDRMTLRLDMEDWEGMKRYAHYTDFIVADEELGFKLTYKQMVDSTAGGDQLGIHNTKQFQTYDKPSNDKGLASKFSAGFWWPDGVAETSVAANLNGVYYQKGQRLNQKNGIFWNGWKGKAYSMKKVEMKLRPEYFPVTES